MSLLENPKTRLFTATLAPSGSVIASSRIVWRILKSSDGYASRLIKSVVSNADNVNIDINYVETPKIHSFEVSLDNKLISRNIWGGPTVGTLTTATHRMFHSTGSLVGYIRGNATNFTLNGDATGWQTVTNTISNFTFSPPLIMGGTTANNLAYYNWATASYVGTTADRRVVKLLSGLGSATFGYQLQVASTGLAVTSNSTTDVIEIMLGSPRQAVISATLNGSTPVQGNIFTKDSRLYITAYMEVVQ